ncbi:MAG: ArnT family glycosyltransferase, partial [Aggregatilineales bacterium]
SETRFSFKLHYLLPVLLIIALAYALRVILIVERAAYDYQFYPTLLSDPEVYLRFGRAFLTGDFPYRPYVNQPLISYWVGFLMGVVGDSVPLIRLTIAAVDATMCGFLAMGGWLLTGRASGGYIAALLFAIYPVSMFYGTTILIAPLAAWLYILFFVLMLWQRQQLTVWKTVLLGIVIGLIIAARMNLAPIAVFWVIWLFFELKNPRLWLLHTMIAVVLSVMVIAPFTLWNISQGRVQLMAANSPGAFYSGNNRDATGMGSTSPAMELAERDVDWTAALQRDINLDTARYIGLMLRKGAIFWDGDEPGNIHSIGGLSLLIPILTLVPLNFLGLAVMGLCGLALLYYQSRHLALFFVLLFVWLTFAMMISFSISRLRYPAIVPLMLLASYFWTQVWVFVRTQNRQQFSSRKMLKRYTIPAILIAGVLLFPRVALYGDVPPLPPKRNYTALPVGTVPLNITYDEKVRLVGWRTLPDWDAPAQGFMMVDEAYIVELFWEVLTPVDTDYSFFTGFFIEGERIAGFDRRIGEVSFPPKGTSYWQPGDIYSEIIGFRPHNDAQTLQSGEVWVDVYLREQLPDNEFGEIVDVPVSDPPGLEIAVLQDFALYPDDVLQTVPPDLPGQNYIFGVAEDDVITLAGYVLPENSIPGEDALLTFYWQAGSPIEGRYNMFIHVMDENNELATQGDAQPHPALVTNTWREGDGLISDISVPMPDTPGIYSIYIGLIEVVTGQRLSVDAPDFRPFIGEITLSGD